MIRTLITYRTMESLYEELVMNGIIVRSPQIRLQDFEGEYSYLGTTLRQANIEPMPSLSDVRRLVTEFGILPLGRWIKLQGVVYRNYMRFLKYEKYKSIDLCSTIEIMFIVE